MVRPSGTVTFLFTDIEGSTRRWESDPEAMRHALTAHDDVLRTAVEAHEGWLFKHTGDGVCAAFSSARAAVSAAVAAQRGLGLPVRMGVATGEAELRGEDYFGPTLNRTARVMAAGHGGQILVVASTASLASGVILVDLGEHRLRDLSGPTRLFQVAAEGLRSDFPALRTLDEVPGNLPVQSTSFVGRDVEVKEVIELIRAHRLVTLTGVGGVGKTRLAVQVAAELVGEFGDGVWLVELAPVGDPAAVPDAVASVLGITAQAGRSVTDSIAQALSGRSLLIVLDNCEHVLDAAADLVDAVLAGASTVKMIGTSREGLRVGAEQLWPVPSLDLEGGSTSAAVELFVERAVAVNPRFTVGEAAEVVDEICRRLDGIALAIELAAARMVSMSPMEVLERLQDRFRLLAGSRRGLERHQTLRHAVGWSYDLLDDAERTLLNVCSLFADGFDLAAAAHLSDSADEYAVLDVLDSLVRKSLVTAEQTGGRTRYGLLETIRQFAEDQLGSTGLIEQMRDRHATYYAEQAVAHWGLWDGPQQRVALDWVDVELANLRVGFRWATDRGELTVAAAIAAHATMLGWAVQRFEPVGWAEELLPVARVADLAQLPRLYAAASVCALTGRPHDALGYAETAVGLAGDPRYDPFPGDWSSYWVVTAHVIAGGYERGLEICAGLAARSGLARVWGLCGQTQLLAVLGRYGAATAIAEETLAIARAHANPNFVAHALYECGLAYAKTEPARALDFWGQGLAYAGDHRLPFWEANIAVEAAVVETVHGDQDRALTLYESAISLFHESANAANLAVALANLALFFNRIERPDIAAVLYGATSRSSTAVPGRRPSTVGHLRAALGDVAFEGFVATGQAMELADAVRYARSQIELTGQELGTSHVVRALPREPTPT